MSSEYEIYTPEEMGKLLKIGVSQTYKLIHSGKIKYLKIGKLIRIPKQYLIEYIQNNYVTNDEELVNES